VKTLIVMIAALSILLGPPSDGWDPDPEDIKLLSQVMYGEAWICPANEREAVGWCVLHRVDSPDFPNTIKAVITAPSQFLGFSPDNPWEPCWEEARSILIRWHNGERGNIPAGYCWFWGDGRHNYFRNAYIGGRRYIFPEWRQAA